MEDTSSKKGSRERERNGWHGVRDKKESGDREIKGRVYEERGWNNGEKNKSKVSGCACCMRVQ